MSEPKLVQLTVTLPKELVDEMNKQFEIQGWESLDDFVRDACELAIYDFGSDDDDDDNDDGSWSDDE